MSKVIAFTVGPIVIAIVLVIFILGLFAELVDRLRNQREVIETWRIDSI